MTNTDYCREKVDIEIARYAVRTFMLQPDIYSDVSPLGIILPRPYRPDWVQPGEFLGSFLGSVAISGNEWSDGTCTAKCICNRDPIEHVSPHEECTCGIYGCLSLEKLREQYSSYASKFVAVIAAEGTTLIGDVGLRTQYARVVAYWHINDSRYEIPATLQFKGARRYLDLGQMLEAYQIPEYPQQEEGFWKKLMGWA